MGCGLVAAFGGNHGPHGLAVARSAHVAGVQAALFLADNVAADKVAKIRDWGTTAIVGGASYDEANAGARVFAERESATYFHSFADPFIVLERNSMT